MVEQARQLVQEQLPSIGAVLGGVGTHLVPRPGDSAAAEQRVPVVVKIAWVPREDFVRPLAVEHDLDAVARGQLHQVEPGNRPPRYDRLVVEPQDLCQTVPRLFWAERDASQ